MDTIETSSEHALATANTGLAAAAPELAERQKTALELLSTGMSVAEAARRVEVNRRTVFRWIKSDPVFAAAYNQWHAEMEESCRSQLAMLAEAATSAVRGALERGDARMGMQLLKGLGLIAPVENRVMDAEEIGRRNVLEEKRRKNKLEEEERRLVLKEKKSRWWETEEEKLMGEMQTERPTDFRNGSMIVRRAGGEENRSKRRQGRG
jgi:predicted DNA-binding protein YlxM (UPF0122 family)